MPRFASHRVVGPGVYLEVTGIDFQDFETGLVFEHRPGRTFTALEDMQHTLRSLDLGRHALEGARGRGDERTISETFVLAVVTAMTTKTFGKVVANLGWRNVTFPRPVRPGDTVCAESEILATRPSSTRPTQGIVHVRTRALNQDGDLVCEFERHFLVYRRGEGPYAEAGY